jgi:hypothetical protein
MSGWLDPDSLSNLTIVIPLIAAFGVYILRRINNKKTLRVALLTEMRYPEDILQNAEDTPVLPDHDFIPTTIYDSSANNLGLLSQDEVKKVVEYYSYGYYLKNMLNDPEISNTIPRWYLEEIKEKTNNDLQIESFESIIHSSDSPNRMVDAARGLNVLRTDAIVELDRNL